MAVNIIKCSSPLVHLKYIGITSNSISTNIHIRFSYCFRSRAGLWTKVIPFEEAITFAWIEQEVRQVIYLSIFKIATRKQIALLLMGCDTHPIFIRQLLSEF